MMATRQQRAFCSQVAFLLSGRSISRSIQSNRPSPRSAEILEHVQQVKQGGSLPLAFVGASSIQKPAVRRILVEIGAAFFTEICSTEVLFIAVWTED